jgi:hypothetical protein
MVSRLAAVSSFATIVMIVACGSSSEDDLYEKKPGSGADASLGGAAGVSGASGGSAGISGGSGSAGQDSGVAGGSAGAGGVVADAGPDAKPDASGGNNGVGTGKCGNMTCAFLADDFCCKPSSGEPYCANDTVGNGCECSGTFCNTFDIHCDGSEDCAGEICCADTGFTGGMYNVVECRQTCETPQIGGPQFEVCHLGSALCKKGTCSADPGLPAGYGTCK